MNDFKIRIDNLYDGLEKLRKVLDIPKKESELKQLEADSTDPKLWDDQDMAKKVLRNLSNLKDELLEITSISETVNTLKGLSDAGILEESFEKEIKKVEKKLSNLVLLFLFLLVIKVIFHIIIAQSPWMVAYCCNPFCLNYSRQCFLLYRYQ